MPEVSGKVSKVSPPTPGGAVIIVLVNAAGVATTVLAPVEWRVIAQSAGMLTVVIDAVLLGSKFAGLPWFEGKKIGLRWDS